VANVCGVRWVGFACVPSLRPMDPHFILPLRPPRRVLRRYITTDIALGRLQ
jgi:hypothetical protein